MKPKGILTLDVEDWEHANFRQLDSKRAEIDGCVRSRQYAMDSNTDRWISILAESGARSTCFVLGDFARRYPDAVRRLVAAGHEIACHGDTHDLVYDFTRGRFHEYLKRALGQLSSLTGERPWGFRAPSWSVNDEKTPWFCEELEAQGLRYDSSEFPVRTPLYGQGNAPLRPYWKGKILRIPVTVLTLGPFRIPFSSGAFFRLSPLALIRFGLKRAIRLKSPAMVVLHPRELDPSSPRLPLRGWEGAVHYAQLHSTEPKLRALLEEFNWLSIRETYAAELDTSGSALDDTE